MNQSKPYSLNFLRLALRALDEAGRRPWLAFFSLRWVLAIEGILSKKIELRYDSETG